jgi:hypothetical protein
MPNGEPRRIKITIYPNQLQWMDRISTVMNQPRRQTFLECFAEYIGGFKEQVRKTESRESK